MKCKIVQKEIIKSIDGENSDDNMIKYHIEKCSVCSKFYKDSLLADSILNDIENIKSNLTFKDLEIRLNSRKKIYIPTWFIAASLLFASIVGTTFGLCNNYDMNERCFDNYSNTNTTYISMVETIE